MTDTQTIGLIMAAQSVASLGIVVFILGQRIGDLRDQVSELANTSRVVEARIHSERVRTGQSDTEKLPVAAVKRP